MITRRSATASPAPPMSSKVTPLRSPSVMRALLLLKDIMPEPIPPVSVLRPRIIQKVNADIKAIGSSHPRRGLRTRPSTLPSGDPVSCRRRLTVLVSIRRPDNVVGLRKVLLSWTGTKFEYLMPLLLLRSCRNSLLDMAAREAVAI